MVHLVQIVVIAAKVKNERGVLEIKPKNTVGNGLHIHHVVWYNDLNIWSICTLHHVSLYVEW